MRCTWNIFFSMILGSLAVQAQTVPDTVNCPAYRPATSEVKLSQYNPAPEVISGVQFPGNKQILYRGAYETNPQYSLEKVLQGIFGEKDFYIGSPMFWGITQILTGQRTLDHNFLPGGGLPHPMRRYLETRGILSDVETLLSCRRAYSESEANHLAANLMNKVFEYLGRRTEKLYFDIKVPNYYRGSENADGFMNNAIDFIIGTPYDQVAALYGIKTLVLQDKRDRGLDLGFYNYKLNAKWWDGWVDNGEMNIPGYITAEEVLGMQIRNKDRQPWGWPAAMPDADIEYAFYRTEVDGKTLVLVIDGKQNDCLVGAADGKYYPCDKKSWSQIQTEPVEYPKPYRGSQPVGLIGVISDCDSECPEETKAMSQYGVISDRLLPAPLFQRIKSLKVNGKSLRFVRSMGSVIVPVAPAPVVPGRPPAPVRPPFVGIKVVSATSTLNGTATDVTAAAAKFVDGKTSVEYMPRARFLGLPADRQPREFSIEWKCPDKPDKILKHKIDAPSEFGKFTMTCPGGAP